MKMLISFLYQIKAATSKISIRYSVVTARPFVWHLTPKSVGVINGDLTPTVPVSDSSWCSENKHKRVHSLKVTSPSAYMVTRLSSTTPLVLTVWPCL